MRYSEDIIEAVRAGSDIVDVIGTYVKLQKKGANYMGLCPFHNEKSGSFSVSGQRQMYHCFGCGVGGNVITFIMEYENYTFLEAVKYLAERAGIKLPEEEYSEEAKKQSDLRSRLYDIYKLAAKYYVYELKGEHGKTAYQYLKDRELSEETMVHFGLGYSNISGQNLYRYMKQQGYDDGILKESGLFTFAERGVNDKFWNRVMFPIMDTNNKVIAFGGRVMGDGVPKYLNSPETKIFEKSKVMYGLNYARISRKPYFLVCEGYMDVIALHQAGFTNAVASLGTAFTEQHAGLLKRYTKEVILTYDSDEAGVKAALRAIPILKNASLSVKVLNMQPYKDPDEFIKALGTEAYQKRIDEAMNSFFFELLILRKAYDFANPEEKTKFFHETAKKLLTFSDEIERNSYIEAVSREYGVSYEMLRKLVNRYGISLPAGEQTVFTPTQSTQKKQDKESGQLSQKVLLTWLTTEPDYMQKIQGVISPEDFTEPLCREAAEMVFSQYETSGKVVPAQILNHFESKEEQARAAEFFQTELRDSMSEQEKSKAFEETVKKVKQASIETAMERAADENDPKRLQELIVEQARLKKLHIS